MLAPWRSPAKRLEQPADIGRMAAQILVGRGDLRAEMRRRRARASADHRAWRAPARPYRHRQSPIDRFGLVGSVISPTAMIGMADRRLDGARQRHLIAGADRDLLRRRIAAARDMDGGAAARFERAGEGDGLLDVPAALDPIGRRNPHADRHVGRHDGAHRVEDFERKAHPVLERAAITVARAGCVSGDRNWWSR